MFNKYNHLGFNNPYFFNNNGSLVIEKDFAAILKRHKRDQVIDYVAVIELLSKKYIFGDRTLIQGINRTPWLAKPNKEYTKWNYAEVPKHGLNNLKEHDIAHSLFEKICNEIEICIGGRKKIGVLLSGGMDSRIVAGALDFLIKSNKLSSIEVTGLTWGNDGTRDVVYAKEIAIRLGWKWKHYTVTASDLLNNITETAIHGCEYSPIHLHAIPQIRDDNDNLDIILAGSYGDSIGRAEYAGWKVNHLRSIKNNISNFSNFIKSNAYINSTEYINEDVNSYHNLFPKENQLSRNELDYQLHYMRRMLNPCMELLTKKIEFYQVFTHPEVYGYMWSITPKRRNDLVYKYMLNEFMTKLDDIPWARTGILFGDTNGKPDNYLKSHYSYIEIIRDEIIDDIEVMIFSGQLHKLNIFNLKAIKKAIRLIKLIPSNNLLYHEEIIWLASLARMTKMYNIKGEYNIKENQIVVGSMFKSVALTYLYSMLYKKVVPTLKKLIQKV